MMIRCEELVTLHSKAVRRGSVTMQDADAVKSFEKKWFSIKGRRKPDRPAVSFIFFLAR